MEVRNIVLLVVFILGIVYMQFINANPVDEIIKKYAEARGGKDNLKAIESVYMEGFRKMLNTGLEIKVTSVSGKLLRNDFIYNNTPGFTVVTPDAGWYLIPMSSSSVKEIPKDRLNLMRTELDIAGPLIDYATKGSKAEFEGKEEIEGKMTYKIRLTLKAGKDIIYFIDTKTNLLVQSKQMSSGVSTNVHDNVENEKEVITNYSDYRSIDGIMFPHVVSNPGTGLDGGSITFSKIELNKPVDESKYAPSAEQSI